MKILRFTDRGLATLPEGKYRDFSVPAFCIRIGKNRRTFYTVREGKVTTIGHFPLMSLQEARTIARRILDPINAPRPATTFKGAYETYQRTHLINYRPNTQYQTDRLIERYCTPLFHRNIADLRPADFTTILNKAGVSPANHLFGVLRTFLRWCERQDYIDRSPLAKLTKPHREQSRDRLLTDSEIQAIWTASSGAYGLICKALILSGQRRGQYARFQQSYIQGDTVVWPASAMKHGREHVIPLSPSLKALLAQLPASHNTWGKPMLAIKKTTGIHDVTLHDFRRYFSSTMRQLKVPIDVTEHLLAHTAGSRTEIQRIYDRYDRLPELREALALYESHLRRSGIQL